MGLSICDVEFSTLKTNCLCTSCLFVNGYNEFVWQPTTYSAIKYVRYGPEIFFCVNSNVTQEQLYNVFVSALGLFQREKTYIPLTLTKWGNQEFSCAKYICYNCTGLYSPYIVLTNYSQGAGILKNIYSTCQSPVFSNTDTAVFSFTDPLYFQGVV